MEKVVPSFAPEAAAGQAVSEAVETTNPTTPSKAVAGIGEKPVRRTSARPAQHAPTARQDPTTARLARPKPTALYAGAETSPSPRAEQAKQAGHVTAATACSLREAASCSV